jgi:hypothetical protein
MIHCCYLYLQGALIGVLNLYYLIGRNPVAGIAGTAQRYNAFSEGERSRFGGVVRL